MPHLAVSGRGIDMPVVPLRSPIIRKFSFIGFARFRRWSFRLAYRQQRSSDGFGRALTAVGHELVGAIVPADAASFAKRIIGSALRSTPVMQLPRAVLTSPAAQ